MWVAAPKPRSTGLLAILLSILVITVLAACSNRSPRVDPVSPEHQALENAYQLKDAAGLDRFFQSWEGAIPSLTAEQQSTLPEIHQALYEIFEVFYTPDQIARIGNSEAGTDIYSDYPYYVIQNVVDFTVVDRLVWDSDWTPNTPDPKTLQEDKIKNFRPAIAAAGKRSVFLSPRYEKVLAAFLGNELSEVGEEHLMNAPMPRGESRRRADFLASKIRVMAGHWGGWQIATHPYVNRIEINEALTAAKVEFSLIYEGGEASFQRKDGGWKMTDSQLLWIQ